MIIKEKLPNETKPEYVLRLLKKAIERDIDIYKEFEPDKNTNAIIKTLEYYKKFIAEQELTYELYDSLMGDL